MYEFKYSCFPAELGTKCLLRQPLYKIIQIHDLGGNTLVSLFFWLTIQVCGEKGSRAPESEGRRPGHLERRASVSTERCYTGTSQAASPPPIEASSFCPEALALQRVKA